MANEIYDSTWWGNTIDTASSIGTSTEMIQGQFNLTKLRDELVTNGDFATDSNWIKQSSWTISNGAANYDGISSGNYLRQSWSPLTIGKTYRMTFDISDGSAYLQIRSGTSLLFEGLNIVLYGNGSHVIEAKAISNLDNLRIYAYTSGGGTYFSIDNISVKEVRATTVEASKCLADAIHRIGIQDIQN